MFLKHLSVSNFKAFGSSQKVDLDPVTLLYGQNSAGKSSFIQSVVFLHEALGGNFNVHHTKLGGKTLNLGGFDNFVHGGKKKNKSSVLFDLYLGGEVAGFENIELLLDFKKTEKKILLRSILINKDSRGLLEIGWDSSSSAYKLAIIDESGLWDFDEAQKGAIFKSFEVGVIDNFLVPENLIESAVSQDTNIASCAKKISFFLTKLSTEIKSIFKNIFYLGGFRELTSRGVLDGASSSNLANDCGGLFLWNEIREDHALRERVNHFLGKLFNHRYELVVRNYFSADTTSEVAKGFYSESRLNDDDEGDFCGKLLRSLDEETESDMSHLRVRDTLSNLDLLPQDLGFGVGQVIPIIAASYSPGKLIMIEQPETHLHPKQQSILADLLIENAVKYGTRFIVETHSEFLLLRLLRRIGETDAGKLPDEDKNYALDVGQLSVVYVNAADKQEGRTSVKVERMEVSPKGRLRNPWPKGFFSEKKEDIFWHAKT